MKKFTVVLLAGILAMGLAGCSLETEKAPEEQDVCVCCRRKQGYGDKTGIRYTG